MNGEQLAFVRALAADAEAPLPASFSNEERIRVLDAASDLVDVRYAKELPAEPGGQGWRIKRRVLERRAEVLQPSPELVIAPPLDRQPHRSHGSGRFTTAVGGSTARGSMLSLGYRLALHDLADPPAGYPELSQIEFFPTNVRFYPRDRAIELESVDLVNVLSLHPVSSFDQRLSWRVRAGALRVRDGGCDGCLLGSFAIGTGFSIAAAEEAITLFALAEMDLQASPGLRGIEGKAVRGGIGPAGGVRLRLGASAVWMTSAQWRWFPRTASPTGWAVDSSLRWEARPGLAVGLTGRAEPAATEGSLQIFAYY
jgi:hypothetical protein